MSDAGDASGPPVNDLAQAAGALFDGEMPLWGQQTRVRCIRRGTTAEWQHKQDCEWSLFATPSHAMHEVAAHLAALLAALREEGERQRARIAELECVNAEILDEREKWTAGLCASIGRERAANRVLCQALRDVEFRLRPRLVTGGLAVVAKCATCSVTSLDGIDFIEHKQDCTWKRLNAHLAAEIREAAADDAAPAGAREGE